MLEKYNYIIVYEMYWKIIFEVKSDHLLMRMSFPTKLSYNREVSVYTDEYIRKHNNPSYQFEYTIEEAVTQFEGGIKGITTEKFLKDYLPYWL